MDLETVEQIVALLSANPISEITLERDGVRIVAKKPLTARPQSALPPSPEALSLEEEDTEEILTELLVEEAAVPEPILLTAGMVGLFRHSEPPLGYGTMVVPGQVVGSIEAMKVLNDVRADAPGQVVDVFVEEGAPVEYGQALFRLLQV